MKKRLLAVSMLAAIVLISTANYCYSQQAAENKFDSSPTTESNVVWAIEPGFSLVGSFHEGLAKAKRSEKDKSINDTSYGYIDKSGTFVIEPQFQEAGDFSEGYALVEKEHSMVFIDKAGKTVIQDLYEYKNIHDFKEGLALISIEKTVGFDKLKTYTFTNKKGRIAIKSSYRSASSFYEGLSCVGVAEAGGVIRNPAI